GTIVRAIKDSPTPPQSLIQASAVGFYGDRGEEELTEDAVAGSGFLAEVTQAWEDATAALEGSSTRVALARTGLVIAQGGAMAPLRLQTMLGVGGAIGSGRQWWPWISLRDEVGALVFLLEHAELSGPFNLAGPSPVISREVTQTLAQMMKRPHWLGLPEFAVKLLLGEAGRELLLPSQKVIPHNLTAAGFEFDDQTIEQALKQAF
ncbi:MAG: TIGR01777 family oxidoreductase, partial [Pontimonas sp.]